MPEEHVIFASRTAAGKALGEKLASLADSDPVYRDDLLVIALPRGGVPVAFEVARALNAPLDLAMVRKIGVPRQPELAAAAIVDGETPIIVRNEDVIRAAGISDAELDEMAQGQLREIKRRRRVYLQGRARESVAGRTVVIVDDGIATGATALAAIRAVRQQGPKAIVLAVPVCPRGDLGTLRREADRFLALEEHAPFYGVGAHYRAFHQVSDEEVTRFLSEPNDRT